jgi:Xaa-Pro aminopeptidase
MSIIVYGDTSTSPELRNELPLSVPDPFLYVEHGGRQVVVVAGYEVPRLESFGLTALPLEQFGLDDLLSSGASRSHARLDSMVRACRELGIESAHVPPTFPLELADRMREERIVVRVDRDLRGTSPPEDALSVGRHCARTARSRSRHGCRGVPDGRHRRAPWASGSQ